MGQRFCDAVVWIAELVHVKSWKLVEISLLYFGLVERIFENSLTKV